MEPRGAPVGPPTGRPSAGDPVRIWFRVGLPCSPTPNGLVGDGALRPANERQGAGMGGELPVLEPGKRQTAGQQRGSARRAGESEAPVLSD